MKKTLLIVAITVLALGVLGAGVAFAQGEQPSRSYGPGTMTLAPGASAGVGGRGGYGFTHDYVVQVLAGKLGLTEAQVEDALANGATMYQLALDNGIAEADLPAFMNEVHQAAFDKAVADGVLTQEQAGWMLERMGGMFTDGAGLGDCPMDGTHPQDGTGLRGMTGGMGGHGGGRWVQTQP